MIGKLKPVLRPTPVGLAYHRDPILRPLLDAWATDRRCPVPTVDRLLELDLPVPAECARWASDPLLSPDLPPYVSPYDPVVSTTRCGPYPCLSRVDGVYYWAYVYGSYDRTVCDEIRPVWVTDTSGHGDHPTPVSAIVWLLTNWRIR